MRDEFLRPLRTAGPEEVLHARAIARRGGARLHGALRSGGGRHHRAGRHRDVERVQRVPDRAAAAPPLRRKVEYATGVVVDRGRLFVTTARRPMRARRSRSLASAAPICRRRQGDGPRAVARATARAICGRSVSATARPPAPKQRWSASPIRRRKPAATRCEGVRRDGVVAGSNGDRAVEPAPALGFAGAAVIDAMGNSPALSICGRSWRARSASPRRRCSFRRTIRRCDRERSMRRRTAPATTQESVGADLRAEVVACQPGRRAESTGPQEHRAVDG